MGAVCAHRLGVGGGFGASRLESSASPGRAQEHRPAAVDACPGRQRASKPTPSTPATPPTPTAVPDPSIELPRAILRVVAALRHDAWLKSRRFRCPPDDWPSSILAGCAGAYRQAGLVRRRLTCHHAGGEPRSSPGFGAGCLSPAAMRWSPTTPGTASTTRRSATAARFAIPGWPSVSRVLGAGAPRPSMTTCAMGSRVRWEFCSMRRGAALLLVADTGNHRVLIWEQRPDGKSASRCRLGPAGVRHHRGGLQRVIRAVDDPAAERGRDRKGVDRGRQRQQPLADLEFPFRPAAIGPPMVWGQLNSTTATLNQTVAARPTHRPAASTHRWSQPPAAA